MRPRSQHKILSLAIAGIAVPLAGCAGGGGPATDGDPLRSALGQETIERLTGSTNGLELRKWLIADDPGAIASALGPFAAEPLLPPERERQLRRNGLRLVRMPLDDVDELLGGLGGATMDVRGWHGQIFQWRPLLEIALGPAPRTVAIDGRIRRYDAGRMTLLARSWTAQMEDGPRLQLQLAPAYRGPARRSDLRQLLGGPESTPTVFHSLACELLLEPGWAYLLTAEAPAVDWSGSADDATAPADDLPIGPGVEVPPTLGQLMLSSDTTPPVRAVLLFVPKIPRELMPPTAAPDNPDEEAPT